MPSLNSCTFIGNLGRDPELRYTSAGNAVAQFTVAVNRRWKGRDDDEWKEETEWVRTVVWGDLASRLADADEYGHIEKGDLVFVHGRMQTRQWEGQDGQKRYTTEIIADRVMRLKRRGEDRQETPLPDEPGGMQPASDYNDDLPF